MSTYSIQITEPAENDVKEIVKYIAQKLLEPKAAKKTLHSIVSKISSLEEIPYRNGIVSDERLGNLGIRKILAENYIIFYKVVEEGKTVTIVRILYNRRNWEELL